MTSEEEIQKAVDKIVRDAAEEQGLPEKVEDVSTLMKVARIFKRGKEDREVGEPPVKRPPLPRRKRNQ
jgi:hypothetical protein